jgi:hypothetical protein
LRLLEVGGRVWGGGVGGGGGVHGHLVVRLYRHGSWWDVTRVDESSLRNVRVVWDGIVLVFKDARVQLKHEVRSGGVGCDVAALARRHHLSPQRHEASNKAQPISIPES